MDDLKVIEDKRYYQECLIRSLEAKLDRVDPFSVEFDEIMNALFLARDTIREIGLQKLKFNIEKATT